MKKYLLSVTAVLLLALSSQILRAQSAQETDPDLQYGTELLKPGTQAPDFKLNDINGKTVKLKRFRGKDVVLVFWASWCPDCRAEVPLLKEMYAAADPDKVVFISVSYDREFGKFEQYVRESYDFTPLGIISYLHLLDVDYNDVAFGGHFGKDQLPWEMDDEYIEDIFGEEG